MTDDTTRPPRGRIAGERLWQWKFLDAHLDHVRYPDGSEGEQVLIHHPGAAAVVPFVGRFDDPDPEIRRSPDDVHDAESEGDESGTGGAHDITVLSVDS